MRTRNRLVAVLVSVVSFGAMVAVLPSGGAAARTAATIESRGRPIEGCNQAKELSGVSKELTEGYLAKDQKTLYKEALDQLVTTACDPTGTCGQMKDLVAELRGIRGLLLPADDEAELEALEDALLQLSCAS